MQSFVTDDAGLVMRAMIFVIALKRLVREISSSTTKALTRVGSRTMRIGSDRYGRSASNVPAHRHATQGAGARAHKARGQPSS